MKNIVRIAAYTVLVIAICLLAFMRLQKNKTLNAEMAQLANVQGEFYPVKTVRIEFTNQKTNISTTGFLESTTDLIVLSETQGRILEIYKKKGDQIKEGDIIAKVDDELMQAQFTAAQASYEQLKKEVERFTTLCKQNAVTSQKLEEIKLNMANAKANYISSRRQLTNTKIKAPVSGFIENEFIEVGQFIGGGTQICNIININNLILKIPVSEYDYQFIKAGLKATISSVIYPQKSFSGQLTFIGKKAGYGNTFDTEIKVNNTENLLKAGMFVNVNINQEHDSQSIYVPRRAINGSLKDAYVFVVNNEVTEKRPVTTGKLKNEMVEVVNGLRENDELIIEGNYNLYDGAKIKVME